MQIIFLFFLFVIGIVTLYLGAETLVRSAVQIAKLLKISPLIIGLTVVSFGTSAPEFMVSIVAALQNSKDIAIGNIIGSNIANIGLIIGLSALFKPLLINRRLLNWQVPLLFVSSLIVFYFFHDLYFSHFEGIVFLILMFLFIASLLITARKEQKTGALSNRVPEVQVVQSDYSMSLLRRLNARFLKSESYLINGILLGMGIVFLALGSKWLIDAAVQFARIIGISDVVIGISVVALGTSLPELATSVVSAIKKEADISVGNIVGSNLFNTLFVLGFIGTVNPLSVDHQTAFLMVPIMIFFTLAFSIVMWTKKIIQRWEAVFLLGAYLLFIFYLYYINM